MNECDLRKERKKASQWGRRI